MIYDEIYPDPKDAYKVYNGSESRFQKKFIFDNIVFIISLLLLINMVAGIIIDKFGNLRDEFMASKIGTYINYMIIRLRKCMFYMWT
jgi:hypothetical protein